MLPILFAGGMCLMDTIDGVFTNGAYGWALNQTGPQSFTTSPSPISVAGALIIGAIGLIGVLVE